jgi:hypothetical protein
MYRPDRTVLLTAFLLSATALHAQTLPDVSGHWEGKIQIPDHELSVTVDVARNSAGAWIGSVSIPPESMDVPLTDIAIDGSGVRFAAGLPGKTSFEGSLSPDARAVSGTVSNAQGGVSFQLARSGDANVKVPPASSRLTKNLEGTWQGALDADGTKRRVLMKLSAAPDGTAVGTLVAVDQGNVEIPVTTVTLEDNRLQLDVRSVSGSYRGTLGPEGEISGEWTERSVRLPLTFRHEPG